VLRADLLPDVGAQLDEPVVGRDGRAVHLVVAAPDVLERLGRQQDAGRERLVAVDGLARVHVAQAAAVGRLAVGVQVLLRLPALLFG
jgi:hypothetical protein